MVEGLPVHGYQSQTEENVALVNQFKQNEERMLRDIDTLMMDPNARYDKRCLAIAMHDMQTAFMWLNRAVFQPKRIQLPEDATQQINDPSLDIGNIA